MYIIQQIVVNFYIHINLKRYWYVLNQGNKFSPLLEWRNPFILQILLYQYMSLQIVILALMILLCLNAVMKCYHQIMFTCCDKKRERNLRNPEHKEHYFYRFSSLCLLEYMYLNSLWLFCFYINSYLQLL